MYLFPLKKTGGVSYWILDRTGNGEAILDLPVIYALAAFTDNGHESYVGATKCLRRRLREHATTLRRRRGSAEPADAMPLLASAVACGARILAIALQEFDPDDRRRAYEIELAWTLAALQCDGRPASTHFNPRHGAAPSWPKDRERLARIFADSRQLEWPNRWIEIIGPGLRPQSGPATLPNPTRPDASRSDNRQRRARLRVVES